MKSIENKILSILNYVDNNMYLLSRENKQLEFKENFNYNNKVKYMKTMAAFANNCGGIILFGIKDSPRIASGMANERFDSFAHDRFDEDLRGFFLPEIEWISGTILYQEKKFGYISVTESKNKPIICSKNESSEKINNGDIYYRYRGQTRKIEYPQLNYIIQAKIDSERTAIMNHLKKIANVGADNVALIDLYSGGISTNKITDKHLVVDKNLLLQLKEQVKFIEEGRFSETEGDPTLKIIGNIETTTEVLVPDISPDIDYPYLEKDIAKQLNITSYQARTLIWKLQLKEQKKYHLPITTTSSETKKPSITNKYSQFALMLIAEYLNENKDKPNFLQVITNEYNARK